MLKPIGLINGHYECRFLDESLPIFTDLLAMEIEERKEKQATARRSGSPIIGTWKRKNGRTYFIFADINRNWWEVTS